MKAANIPMGRGGAGGSLREWHGLGLHFVQFMSHGKSCGVFRRFCKERTCDNLSLNDPSGWRATSSDRLEANDDPRVTVELTAEMFSLRHQVFGSALPVAAPRAEARGCFQMRARAPKWVGVRGFQVGWKDSHK